MRYLLLGDTDMAVPKTCIVDHVIDEVLEKGDHNPTKHSAFLEINPKYQLRNHEIFRADLGTDGTLNFTLNCDHNKIVLFGSIYEKGHISRFGGFFGKQEFPVRIVINDFIFIFEKDNQRIKASVKRKYGERLDSILINNEKIIEYIQNNGMETIECERL